jgi:hypothetical protein
MSFSWVSMALRKFQAPRILLMRVETWPVRQRYWTLMLRPKFSRKERGRRNLSRFYVFALVEYCRFVPGKIIAEISSSGATPHAEPREAT